MKTNSIILASCQRHVLFAEQYKERLHIPKTILNGCFFVVKILEKNEYIMCDSVWFYSRFPLMPTSSSINLK